MSGAHKRFNPGFEIGVAVGAAIVVFAVSEFGHPEGEHGSDNIGEIEQAIEQDGR